MNVSRIATATLALTCLIGCGGGEDAGPTGSAPPPGGERPAVIALYKYAATSLDEEQGGDGELLAHLAQAGAAVDRIFWRQVFGDGAREFVDALADADVKRYVEINYGPWDRLSSFRPFLPVGTHPEGARFYPEGIETDELQSAAESAEALAQLTSPFTVVRRGDGGVIETRPYSEEYREGLERTATKLRHAAAGASPKLARYLELRAQDLLRDDYSASEGAWAETLDEPLTAVVGPLSKDEDRLFGMRFAFGSMVMRRSGQATERLAERVELLASGPAPWSAPERGASFLVYDLLQCTGECAAGPKRVAITLPVLGEARRGGGAHDVIFANVTRKKFEATVVPVAKELLVPSQREIDAEAYLLHNELLRVARRFVVDAPGEAAQAQAWFVRSLRAEVTALAMAEKLFAAGQVDGSLDTYYRTAIAGMFRIIRMGDATAQGRSSVALCTHLQRSGALTRGDEGWSVDGTAAGKAVAELLARLVRDGRGVPLAEVGELTRELLSIDQGLGTDLLALDAKLIPVDLDF